MSGHFSMVPTVVFVAHGGSLEAKSAILAASLRARLDSRIRIIAAIATPKDLWGALMPSTQSLFQQLGIETREIENPFGIDYPIGNKFSALSLGGDLGYTLFLDTDMYCLRAPNFEYLGQFDSALKPADMALVPTSEKYWARLYRILDLELPSLRVVTSVTGELMPSYFNAGFIWIRQASSFARQWLEVARRVSCEPDLEYKWPWLDQLSIPLTLAHLRQKVEVVGERYNYPLHLKPLSAGRDPYFCHYHNPSVLSREPVLLRDLNVLCRRWPNLLETLQASPDWASVLIDIGGLQSLEVAQLSDVPGVDLIVTGLPRSGTSFLCRILSERPDTVVINEPSEVFPALAGGGAPWGVACLYADIRRELLAGRPVLNKHIDGKLVDDTARERDLAVPYLPTISNPAFTLGTKNTLAYLVRLRSLLKVMPSARCIALVRHPYDCLASWADTFDHLRNASLESQRFGNPGDPGMTKWQRVELRGIVETEDIVVRRALWWRFLANCLLDAGAQVRWMRYEDYVSDPQVMTELLLGKAPLPELQPLHHQKAIAASERSLISGVVHDVAERLCYVL